MTLWTYDGLCFNIQPMIKIPEVFTESLEFDDPAIANEIFGPANRNLEILSSSCDVRLSSKGATLNITASDDRACKNCCNLFLQLYSLGKKGVFLNANDLGRAYEILAADPGQDLSQVYRDAVFVQTPRKTVNARNLAQKQYLDALKNHELVFAVGPAGTGKTYLAMAMAISMLQKHRIKKIVLCRPAVEAGEKLGFLPGDLAEKVNPYLRPLYDALYDMTPQAKAASMIETGIIEIAPLAFMRGRTLNDAFIILDEAQNTTQEQMKMFLTRMGFGSRMVVTGDITQIDLPQPVGEARPRSGLIHALSILKNVKGLAVHTFSKNDVVRHPLVGAIVSAYDDADKNSAAR